MAIRKESISDKQSTSDSDILKEYAKESNAKGSQVVFNPLTDKEHFDVKDWISTGSIALDYKMSGTARGGVAYGYITEFAGESQSGKSLLAWHIIKDAQVKQNAIALYYDVESRVNNAFMDLIGIDRSRVVINDGLKSAEEIFNNISLFLKKIALGKNPNRYAVIVIDSIAQMTSIEELDKEYGEKTMATKARLLHELFRKISTNLKTYNVALVLLNQVTQNMNKKNKYDDDYIIPGGTAIEHNASTRVRLFPSSAFKDKDNEIIGNRIRAKITKNSFIPAHKTTSFPLYYANGIANEESVEEILVEKGIISGTTWKTLQMPGKDGREYKWQGIAKFRELYLNDDAFHNYCLEELDKILKYNPQNWYDVEKTEEITMSPEKQKQLKEDDKLDSLIND